MSNLSHTIRSFNRFELTYLVTLLQTELIRSVLLTYLDADEHGGISGSYLLTSLYNDSPDYRCYWEKVDGCKCRRKLRIRCYEDDNPLTNETPVFVEVKQRMDHITWNPGAPSSPTSRHYTSAMSGKYQTAIRATTP